MLDRFEKFEDKITVLQTIKVGRVGESDQSVVLRGQYCMTCSPRLVQAASSFALTDPPKNACIAALCQLSNSSARGFAPVPVAQCACSACSARSACLLCLPPASTLGLSRARAYQRLVPRVGCRGKKVACASTLFAKGFSQGYSYSPLEVLVFRTSALEFTAHPPNHRHF